MAAIATPTTSPTKKKPIRPNRLRELRERQRLTQQEVATLTGFALSTVCKHEALDRGLTEEALVAYSKVFKVKSYEIFINPSEFHENREAEHSGEGSSDTESSAANGYSTGFEHYHKMGVGS